MCRITDNVYFFRPQQRIHNIIAETFWNPVSWPFSKRFSRKAVEREKEKVKSFSSQKRTGAPPSPPPFPPSQRIPQLLRISDDEEPTEPQPSEESQTEKDAGNETEEEAVGKEVAGKESGLKPDNGLKNEHLHRDGELKLQKECEPSLEEFEPSLRHMEETETDDLSKQSAWEVSSLPPITIFGRSAPLADAEAERLSKELQASGNPSLTT